MELLVVTLAHRTPETDADGLSHIRFVLGSVRNAPGLVSIRSYSSREGDRYYLTLVTWEDEEYWQKAQERHNPKRLLMSSAPDLLISPPKQWLMHYLWGYRRPAAQPVLAAAHVASVRADQADYARRGWIEALRRQVVQPTLALSSALLARGVEEEASAAPSDKASEDSFTQGSIFLNLLSWPDEGSREEFYVDQDYQGINRFLSSVGIVQIIPLEPI
jgi:heme-degrading monooxygenase HmoA